MIDNSLKIIEYFILIYIRKSGELSKKALCDYISSSFSVGRCTAYHIIEKLYKSKHYISQVIYPMQDYKKTPAYFIVTDLGENILNELNSLLTKQ